MWAKTNLVAVLGVDVGARLDGVELFGHDTAGGDEAGGHPDARRARQNSYLDLRQSEQSLT